MEKLIVFTYWEGGYEDQPYVAGVFSSIELANAGVITFLAGRHHRTEEQIVEDIAKTDLANEERNIFNKEVRKHNNILWERIANKELESKAADFQQEKKRLNSWMYGVELQGVYKDKPIINDLEDTFNI